MSSKCLRIPSQLDNLLFYNSVSFDFTFINSINKEARELRIGFAEISTLLGCYGA